MALATATPVEVARLFSVGAAQVATAPAEGFRGDPALWLAVVFNGGEVLPTVSAIAAETPSQLISASIGVTKMADLPAVGGDGQGKGIVTGVKATMEYDKFPAVAPKMTLAMNVPTPLIGLRIA